MLMVTPEILDAAYTSLMTNKKQEQFATDAESLRMRYYNAVKQSFIMVVILRI